MIKTSVEDVQIVSTIQLDHLFIEHGFDQKLAQCHQIVIEDKAFSVEDTAFTSTTAKKGTKFRQTLNGPTIAVIFHYTHSDRTQTRHIRMLRVKNTEYRVAIQAPLRPAFK